MRTLQYQELIDHSIELLELIGSSSVEANRVASNLVMANLSGHDSHGVGMLPRYAESYLEGCLQPNTSYRILNDLGALIALDGQRGFGQIVGEDAMSLGIDRANQLGSCILSIANAHHLGRIGHFAEQVAEAGLVSIHLVNVLSSPAVAIWGGSDGRHGTNPFCIGVPVINQKPFILDFATSLVAQGKMRVAHNSGKSVEPGILLDSNGKPTTDPSVVVVPNDQGKMGAILPFGEHKGSGLAVACELLGGALTGSGTLKYRKAPGRGVINGMLSILIKPNAIGPQSQFETEVMGFIEAAKQTKPAANVDSVLLAGEPEQLKRIERMKNGIEIDDQTWEEILGAKQKVLDAKK